MFNLVHYKFKFSVYLWWCRHVYTNIIYHPWSLQTDILSGGFGVYNLATKIVVYISVLLWPLVFSEGEEWILKYQPTTAIGNIFDTVKIFLLSIQEVFLVAQRCATILLLLLEYLSASWCTQNLPHVITFYIITLHPIHCQCHVFNEEKWKIKKINYIKILNNKPFFL